MQWVVGVGANHTAPWYDRVSNEPIAHLIKSMVPSALHLPNCGSFARREPSYRADLLVKRRVARLSQVNFYVARDVAALALVRATTAWCCRALQSTSQAMQYNWLIYCPVPHTPTNSPLSFVAVTLSVCACRPAADSLHLPKQADSTCEGRQGPGSADV